MNKKPKIATVLGARPQFVKASMVSPVLSRFSQEIILHTGQHFEANMSDIFFQELSLPTPKYHLNIHGGTHGDMTGRMLIAIEKVFIAEKPDMVLVYGDTNSTLAAALSASKLKIPLAHIEAGLRSFNKKMPEEINRIVTDQLSSIYFVTSLNAKKNLENEGCNSNFIYEVGDVMYDLALKTSKAIAENQNKNKETDIPKMNDYILITLHRSENIDDDERFKKLIKLIHMLSDYKKIIWILHPRLKKVMPIVQSTFLVNKNNITLLDPISYMKMMQLVINSAAIATDSGGLQKEAYYYKKPCITLRNETEWVELSDVGWNCVLNKSSYFDTPNRGIEEIVKFLQQDFRSFPYPALYGEGNAAEKIGYFLQRIMA